MNPMRILIAEDEPVTREKLTAQLGRGGYEVVSAVDGVAAWEVLQRADAPTLILADVVMPGMSGDEFCRQARAQFRERGLYIILLTATMVSRGDLVHGLDAGADDYLHKPCDPAELQARLQVGERVLGLQAELRHRVSELEEALAQIKQLQGLLPICCYCKKVRDDQNYWHQVESYLGNHSDLKFTHGICPGCFAEQMELLDREDELPDATPPGAPKTGGAA